MDADDEHHPNNDVDDDEEAARRLQEQIWMAELQDDEMPPHHHHWGGGRPDQRQRGADEDDDDENDDDNDDAGAENEDNDADDDDDDPEDGHGVDAMRLRRQPPADNDDDDDNEDDDAAGADEEDEDDDDDDDPDANNANNNNNNNNNLDDNDDDDPPPHNHHRRRRNAIDGGIAGDVIDDTTKGLITRSLKCPLVLYFEILSGGGGGDWEDEDDDDDNNNNNQNDNVDENNEAAAAAAAAGGEDNASNPINAIANDTNDEQRRQKRQLQQQLETLSPDNPILKKGTLIYIGLDKNSKLSLVFDQFCKFVNSKIPKGKSNKGKQSKPQHPIVNAVKPSDFEFVHATILDPEQTVEGSALMKNDRIGVYPDRSRQRAATAELVRQQRESDRKYFRDLRQLLLPHSSISSEGVSLSSTSPSSMCDVVLDCRGRVVDERGYSQNVLATTIRANSILPSKRCRWLGMKIALAREELRRRKEMTISSCEDNNDEDDDDEEEEEEELNVADRVENREGGDAAVPSDGGVKQEQQSDDEDGDIIMAEEPTARNGVADSGHNNMAVGGGAARGVAKVEDDEDDDDRDGLGANNKTETNKSLRAGNSSRQPMDPNSVWVILPDHSPQAVKLLLEYCYTNRVPSLGEEAFVRAGTTASALDSTTSADATGPVPPFPKQEWPDGGMPTVSLHLALAGIALAEEAHMPRLSLMCEIAASQLVDNHNVVDVLSACQIQQQKTGNRLPILRRAAMLDCIMANGSVGIDHLYAHPTFKNNLMERRGLVVPSLLDGSVEIMPTNMNTKEIQRKKEKMVWERKKLFENYDTTDKNKRIMERLKWRKQSVINRRLEIAFGPDFGPESVGLFKRLSKKIWRDTYQKDPPPLPASVRATVGRGTKRKASSPGGGGTGGSAAPDRTRNVRSRHARTNDKLA